MLLPELVPLGPGESASHLIARGLAATAKHSEYASAPGKRETLSIQGEESSAGQTGLEAQS